jgi:hypothetical protein
MQPTPPSETKGKAAGIASWLLLFIGLIPWFLCEYPASLTENVSWLLIGAQRLLQGADLLSFYDGDPPLNICLYMPAVIIGKLLHMTVWRALFFWVAGLVVLAAALVWRLAAHVPGVNGARQITIAASFTVSATILYHLIWGEREQFIYLFLFPLCMLQALITLQIPLPRGLKYAALVLGTMSAFIKPHYLMIPAVFFLHRAWKRKSIIAVIRDADFIFMTAAGLAYLAITFLFFQDYIFVIMPDLIRFYILRRHTWQAFIVMLPFIKIGIMLLLVSACAGFSREAQARIFVPLALFALCAVIVVIQAKGLPYQPTPALGFLLVACAILCHEAINRLFQSRAGALPGIAASLAFAYALISFPSPYPAGDTYADLPFPRYVREHAANGSFFVYMDNMGMVPQTALYTGLNDTSRFSALWFLPVMLETGDKTIFNHFTRFIAADFISSPPSVLMLQRKGYIHARDAEDFDFMSYFNQDPEMAAILKHYRKTETKTFRTADYFGGIPYSMSETMIFDVYERKL